MNYDVVIGVGCSFMNGDRILNNDGKCIGKEYVSGLVLSEKHLTHRFRISSEPLPIIT